VRRPTRAECPSILSRANKGYTLCFELVILSMSAKVPGTVLESKRAHLCRGGIVDEASLVAPRGLVIRCAGVLFVGSRCGKHGGWQQPRSERRLRPGTNDPLLIGPGLLDLRRKGVSGRPCTGAAAAWGPVQ
jgi:hypothetical protein